MDQVGEFNGCFEVLIYHRDQTNSQENAELNRSYLSRPDSDEAGWSEHDIECP